MKLSTLLTKAANASPATRIEWRDRIAEHGAAAIEAVSPWLMDRVLAAFAIRVIERAGANGHVALATQVLRHARSRVPARERADVDWALQRLRASAQIETDASSPTRLAPVATARPSR